MWIHKYQLSALNPLNSKSHDPRRVGFFIKDESTKTADETLGPINPFLQFSDFIHWPELGDPELAHLKPFLMEKANGDLQFPFRFKEADLQPVKSNALINFFTPALGEELERIKESGFECLKFKMGRNFEQEFKSLMKMNLSHFLLRVDLNSTFNFKESKEVLEMLKSIPNLEYVEDPMPYHDYHWSELQKLVPLALDHLSDPSIKNPKNFQYRIIKPIRGFDLNELVQMTYEKKKIVLTNMMDNVVGAWKLYFYYCELKKHLPYHLCTPGFYTHTLFHDYEYVDQLAFNGAEWHYDRVKLETLNKKLSKLSWIKLNYTDSKNLAEILQEAR